MRVPFVLHWISHLDQSVLESTAIPTIRSLSMCVSQPGPLRNEVTDSPDFWAILRKLHQHEEAGPLVFDLLQLTIESNPPIVTAHNYEFVVGLADSFISDGSVGFVDELRNDAQVRRSKGSKPLKVMYGIPFYNLFLL